MSHRREQNDRSHNPHAKLGFGDFGLAIKFQTKAPPPPMELEFLPPAYVVRREGNVLTPVCVSVHRERGGVPKVKSLLDQCMSNYRPPSEGWGKVIVSVCSHFGGGGYPIQPWMGGGPQVSDFWGGSHVSDFQGGGTQSQ